MEEDIKVLEVADPVKQVSIAYLVLHVFCSCLLV